ncbi:hypothetical protein DENSPDRAFT_299680 [Dentipellis sp. KUC8613]|nr:hypothetical protein DENSPDRAFT_299680 [Dentipellis sp. KUC8613]
MTQLIDASALRSVYNQTQTSVTSRVETDDLCAAVCARVGRKAFLQYPPQYRNIEPLRAALAHWDSVVAVQLKNAAVIAALASNDLGARIPLDATSSILVIPTVELLCRVSKTQSAVLISNPGVLLVWDDSLDGVVKFARRIQAHLQSLMHASDVVDPLPYLGGLPFLSAIPQEGTSADGSLLTAPLMHDGPRFTYREPSFHLWPTSQPKAPTTPDLRFALKSMTLHGSPFSSSASSSSMSSSPWTPERTVCLADISPPPAELDLELYQLDQSDEKRQAVPSLPPSSAVSTTPARSVGRKSKRPEVDDDDDTQNDEDEDEYLPGPSVRVARGPPPRKRATRRPSSVHSSPTAAPALGPVPLPDVEPSPALTSVPPQPPVASSSKASRASSSTPALPPPPAKARRGRRKAAPKRMPKIPCSGCSNTFTRDKDRQRHWDVSCVGNPDKKTMRCPGCQDTRCWRDDSLRRHMDKRHGMRLEDWEGLSVQPGEAGAEAEADSAHGEEDIEVDDAEEER